MNKILILVGHTGSGKSEIAINKAVKESKNGTKVALVDLDIVNPYFCIRDYKRDLEEAFDIKVISAEGNERNAELMTISHETMSILREGKDHIIMDTGGDLVGIKVLKQYEELLRDRDYELAFVINDFRPSTSNIDQIKNYIENVHQVTNLKVTSLIYNGNLTNTTNENQIINGLQMAKVVSKELNIPILFTAVSKGIDIREISKLSEDILLIDKYIKNPWD